MGGDEKRSAEQSSLPIYDILAPQLALLAPLLTFVKFHGYPYFRTEVLLCVGGLAAIGALCSLAIALGGSFARVSVLAGLVVFFVDLQFDWGKGLAPFGVATLVIVWLLRDRAAQILTGSFLVLLASALLLPVGSAHPPPRFADDPSDGNTGSPLLVHLIFDEHIGIEGIPTAIPGGAELKQELKDFYLSYGFRLFGRAYSRYENTYNSIPNTLNFTPLSTDGQYADPNSEPMVIRSNAYFSRLAADGRQIHVLQSDYMDYCQTEGVEVAACHTYPIRTFKPLETAPVAAPQKAWVIASMFVGRSAVYRHLRNRYAQLYATTWRDGEGLLPPWTWERNFLGPMTAERQLDDLRAQVVAAERGSVYFAHLMMPHYPYVYDDECRLRQSVKSWLERTNLVLPGGLATNTVESRSERYAAYFEQVRCTHKRLGTLFEAMKAADVFDDAVILVHSDHGSRIALVVGTAVGRDQLSDADYADYFSTLFAVRSPDHAPGYDLRLAALDELLTEAAPEGPPRAVTSPVEPPHVFLRREAFEPMLKQPMRALGNGS